MGAGLARIALEVAPYHVTPVAVNVLVRMALVPLDAGDDHRYWKGWEPCAVAMGRKVPDSPGHETRCKCDICKTRETARKAVSARWTELERARLITRVGAAGTGRRAEYRITLAGLVTASENAGRSPVDNGQAASEDPGRTPGPTASGIPSDCVRDSGPTASGIPGRLRPRNPDTKE